MTTGQEIVEQRRRLIIELRNVARMQTIPMTDEFVTHLITLLAASLHHLELPERLAFDVIVNAGRISVEKLHQWGEAGMAGHLNKCLDQLERAYE